MVTIRKLVTYNEQNTKRRVGDAPFLFLITQMFAAPVIFALPKLPSSAAS